MFNLGWWTLQQTIRVIGYSFLYLFRGGWSSLPRRLMVVTLGLPLFGLLQLLHWIGFLCDEILFRGYRKVVIERPIFVTGVPRSGTTHLQRVLAQHENLTTTSTWMALLAPSITERYLAIGLGKLFSPIAKLLGSRKIGFIERMRSIHAMGLNEPEEDFLVLLPVHSCFLMTILFPQAKSFWQLVDFAEMPETTRKAILQFYRRMVQKHLYVAGESMRYLSKNPSFCTWVTDLQEAFPDGSFILCTRPAEKAVPSQLSSLMPGWQLFHGATQWSATFERGIITMLARYYETIEQKIAAPQHYLMPMSKLTKAPKATIGELMEQIGLTMTASFSAVLSQVEDDAKAYKSKHSYQTNDCHFSWAEVAHQFTTSQARAG